MHPLRIKESLLPGSWKFRRPHVSRSLCINSVFKYRRHCVRVIASFLGDEKKTDIWLWGLLAGNLVVKSHPICQAQQWSLLRGKLAARPRHITCLGDTAQLHRKWQAAHAGPSWGPGRRILGHLLWGEGTLLLWEAGSHLWHLTLPCKKALTPFGGFHPRPPCKWKFKQICAHAGFQVKFFFYFSWIM